MNKIKQKLNNNGGMSILIALVGFMVAAMVSIVIVTAAVTAARRVANDVKETQAHLTLESAAQIIRSELEDTEFTYGFDSVTKTYNISEGDVNTDTTFGNVMKQAVIAVQSSDYPGTITVTLASDNTDTDAVKQVDVSFRMKSGTDGKYDMTFMLETADPEQTIYISADGYCTLEPDENDEYHITWKVVSINRLTEYRTDQEGG